MTGDGGPADPTARQRLLATAAELLSRASDGAITTREICAAAGVTAPTLYHHFGSKRGLLDAVVAAGFDRYLAVKHDTESTGDPIADLRAGWNAHVDFGLDHPAFYTLMYGQPLREEQPPAALEARAGLLQIMTRAHADRQILTQPELAADIVLAANVGVTLSLIAAHPDRRDKQAADTLFDAVLHLLTTPTGGPDHS